MPNKLVDISGLRFGKLVVVRHVETAKEAHWEAVCDCGSTIITRGTKLRTGIVVDCGCGKKARRSAGRRVHGMAETRTYSIWRGMKTRTCNALNKDWQNYGGRGIRLSERWQSFEAFHADMGDCPDGLTIERIDTNGHYEPGNCRWATMKDQQRNRRNNRLVEYRGRTMPLSQACEEAGSGVDWHKARNRLKFGWSLDRAVEAP